MRILALLFAAVSVFAQSVAFPGPGMAHSTSAAIALISHSSAVSSGTAATTAAINNTGANFLIMACIGQNGNVLTPSDSLTNTWAGLTQQSDTISVVKFFYVENATVGASQTFTCTSTSVAVTTLAASFSNVHTSSSFDVQNGAADTGASQTTMQPGSVTPGVNNELLVTALNWSNSSVTTVSIDSSFTITDTRDYSGGTNFGGSMAYFVQGTAGALNPTWTMGASQTQINAVIATFKP